MSTRRSPLLLACTLGLGLLPACDPEPPVRDQTTAVVQEPVPDDGPVAAEERPDDPAAAKTIAALHMAHLKANPNAGVVLGLHEFDGLLPDVTPPALKADVKRLADGITQLQALKQDKLSKSQWVERQVLLGEFRTRSFDLTQLEKPTTNPMFYMDALNLVPYISREYAPIDKRIAAIIDIAEGTPAYLQDAMDNLGPALPRTFVDTALLQARGMVSFVQQDVPAALGSASTAQKSKLKPSLARMSNALASYVTFLEGRQKNASDKFAMGEAKFLAMLEQSQGLKTDLAALQRVAQADLERNFAALEVAAKAVDPKKTTAQVVAMVQREKPKADEILAVATEQSAQMRKFLLDNKLVTIPFEDKAVLRESPPFMRWNAAFLDGAGPFEPGSLPSFYYISPPDPSWPKAEQRSYIPGTTDLLFITIHEVWPGHFLHGLKMKASDSDVLRSYWNYAMGEGWAHYTEEMMWNQGVSEDEKVHVGQLLNALLRNVRFVSAIGLHTGDMTVEASQKLFATKAFQDPGNARQQAVRGTFDPMFLSYTVGKLMILKLRTDYEAKLKAEGKSYTLGGFHDAFLSYGAAPVPVIREQMLGPDAGPAI